MACCKCCCGGEDCTEGQQGKCCCGGPSGTCCQSGEYCCSGACQSEPCSGGACCVEPSSCGDGGSVCLDENGNLDSFNQAWKDEADAKGMNTTVTAYPEIEGLCPEGISGYFGYTCEKAYCFPTFDGSMVPYLCTDDPSGGCLDGVTQEQCETGGGTWHAGKTCADYPCAGACCAPLSGGVLYGCIDRTQAQCDEEGGTFFEGTLCEDNDPCPCICFETYYSFETSECPDASWQSDGNGNCFKEKQLPCSDCDSQCPYVVDELRDGGFYNSMCSPSFFP